MARLTPPAVSPSAAKGTFVAVVEHGATDTTPRPAGAVVVLWIGTVVPENLAENDQLLDPVAGTLSVYDGTALIPLGGGGGAGVSELQMATVFRGTPQAVAIGDYPYISWTGGTILSGEDAWGVPGTALDLAVVINGDAIEVPVDDAVYDIDVVVRIAVDAADAGKTIRLDVTSYMSGLIVERIVPTGGGEIVFKNQLKDMVRAGQDLSSGYGIFVAMDCTQLTVASSITQASVFVVLRG